MLDLRICRSPMSLAARLVHLRVGNQWWPPTGEGAGVGGTSVNAQTSALPPDRLERRVDPSENKTVGAIAHIRPETLAKLDKTLLRRARYPTFLCLLRALRLKIECLALKVRLLFCCCAARSRARLSISSSMLMRSCSLLVGESPAHQHGQGSLHLGFIRVQPTVGMIVPYGKPALPRLWED